MDKTELGFYKFGEQSKGWPKDENGKPEKPAFLEHISGLQLEYDMAVSLLRAYNIPSVHTCPNDGDFGKVILGILGTGMDIYVPESMLEDARNILSADIVPDEELEVE